MAKLNADQVDGMSANGVVRVASASADGSALIGESGDVLSTSIVAPSRGFTRHERIVRRRY